MITVSTRMCGKYMTPSMRVIWSVLVEKLLFVVLLSKTLPRNFLQCQTYDFAYNITNILDIPDIFVFCIVCI